MGNYIPLEANIKHWEELSTTENLKLTSTNSEHCALCTAHPECVDCPVALHTGKPHCLDTPYYSARDALYRYLWAEGNLETFQHEARRELEFLKSLRAPET